MYPPRLTEARFDADVHLRAAVNGSSAGITPYIHHFPIYIYFCCSSSVYTKKRLFLWERLERARHVQELGKEILTANTHPTQIRKTFFISLFISRATKIELVHTIHHTPYTEAELIHDIINGNPTSIVQRKRKYDTTVLQREIGWE